jgi:hypothetical protein
MSIELDKALMARSRRKVRALTFADRVAINLLYDNRKGVSGPVLARVFGVSKNTIYYKSLTGKADSYPTTGEQVNEVEGEIARLGRDEAKAIYLTDEILTRVNTELQRTARRKERRRR